MVIRVSINYLPKNEMTLKINQTLELYFLSAAVAYLVFVFNISISLGFAFVIGNQTNIRYLSDLANTQTNIKKVLSPNNNEHK